jgi:flagellar hook-basal body complex protein FliE
MAISSIGIQGIDQVIAQMRVLAEQASGAESSGKIEGLAIKALNQTQMPDNQLQTAFEQGIANINPAQVMISEQNAEIAQGVLQVQNKFIDAYNEIMRMPV